MAMVANKKNPRGCFLVQGALACGDAGETLRREMAEHCQQFVAALRERFERAQADGGLSPSAGAEALARYFVAVTHGMAVQAAGGASAEELAGVAETALQAWPT